MENAIDVAQLCKGFGEHKVLTQLSMQVPRGAVFGFLGNNGAGKSTLIRLLLGLLTADSGSVRVLGRVPSSAVRRHIGTIVDAPALYDHLTADEFLRLCAALKSVSRSDISRVLQLVDLNGSRQQRISTLSLGMKQRLALANALLGEPELLLLDEPTNGLDPSGMAQLGQLIKHLPATCGATVLISSHQLEEVEKTVSHIGILQQGRLLWQGTMPELSRRFAAHLALQVSEPRQALMWLRNRGHRADLGNDNLLRVFGIVSEELPQLHFAMMAEGIALYQSRFVHPNLTECFHRLNHGLDAVGRS